MPYADNFEEHGRLVRAIIYGRDKTKKTTWAAKAAEAGYNVVLLDGDDGAGVIRQLPIEARKKILVVNVVDIVDRPVFCMFMASLLRPGNAFLWDEQGKASILQTATRTAGHSFILFDTKKFTNNDVLIIDSWTALADSCKIQWAKENSVDLTAVEREGDQFSLFNYQARFLDYCLNKIHTLPCHVIVVGHEQEWEKFKGTGKDRRLVGSFTQPISSTGPHGQKLGKHFSEVLHFTKLSDLVYQIDTGGDNSKAGGSRTLAPKKYNWNEVTPKLLFEAIGAKADARPCLGAQFIPPNSQPNLAVVSTTPSQPDAPAVPAQAQVVDAGSAKPKVSLLGKLGKT
jgi:hypothetical protein